MAKRVIDGTVPPLKWAGGKRWLVPTLLPLWQAHREQRLVEPFVGGLGVTLGLRPQRALLNDINPHLIHFYRCLQSGFRIHLAMRNEEDLYYQHRSTFNRAVNAQRLFTKKNAALFYYMNRTGYNGLCRFNRKGEFNVPFGRYKTINYIRNFTAYQSMLATWQFNQGDFAELQLCNDDFVYADPPYDVPFTSYAQQDFDWLDHQRLAEWLAHLPNPVVLSNQATERVVALYRDLGFELYFLAAPRRISCNGDRTPTLEVLALRNLRVDWRKVLPPSA